MTKRRQNPRGRNRAQLDLPGLELPAPEDEARGPLAGEPEPPEPRARPQEPPLPAGDGEAPRNRSPFAMGKVSRRTAETHLVEEAGQAAFPGPWSVKAVVKRTRGESGDG